MHKILFQLNYKTVHRPFWLSIKRLTIWEQIYPPALNQLFEWISFEFQKRFDHILHFQYIYVAH